MDDILPVGNHLRVRVEDNDTREVAVQPGDILDVLAILVAGGIPVEAIPYAIIRIDSVDNGGAVLCLK